MIFMRMTTIFIAILVILGISELYAARNAKEEAICAPFLTDKSSSPLIASLKRNLVYDEEAEFSCELVLQDESLPMQIRMTIHEGLYYLAVRHIALGLHREKTAARHAKLMAVIVPDSFQFHYFAGSWALHYQVNDLPEAQNQLHECIHGNSSLDPSITAEDRYLAHRDYIRALVGLHRLEEATIEAEQMLSLYPLDFETYFLLKSLSGASTTNSSPSASYLDIIRSIVEKPAAADLSSSPLSLMAKSNLDSFAADINDHLPSLYSLGSILAVDKALNWHLSSWYNSETQQLDLAHLTSLIGDEEDVLVEVAPFPDSSTCPVHDDFSKSCVIFGAGATSRRRNMLFADIIANNFIDSAQNTSIYINVQKDGSDEAPYRAPLHLVKKHLALNHSVFNFIRSNLSDVNLWLSRNPHATQPIASRLHRDAKDNLYVVLQGKKQFAIWSPKHFAAMKTISPSYALNLDGLSHQLNINKFRAYVLDKLSVNDSSVDFRQWHPLLHELVSNQVQYDHRDSHFSTLSSHHALPNEAQQLPPPTAVITLQAGDILYLPTGWFHEVSSFPGIHASINLWWMPPHWTEAVKTEQELSSQMYEELWMKLSGEVQGRKIEDQRNTEL